MKFRAFRIFRGRTLDEVSNFCAKELSMSLKDLFIGLRKLSIEDNLQHFTETVTIEPNQELQIKNRLQIIPDKMIVVRQEGNALIVSGEEIWTSEQVSIKSYGPNAATATILFLR